MARRKEWAELVASSPAAAERLSKKYEFFDQ
jgi:hypothetical protein